VRTGAKNVRMRDHILKECKIIDQPENEFQSLDLVRK
jgi:hypothetical protein